MALVILTLIGLLAGYWRWGERTVVQMLLRGALVLVPVLAAALVPIIWTMSADWIDVRLRQGILAGLVIISGWLAGFLFQEERKQRDRDNRRADTLTALQSEIYNTISKIDNQAITDTARTQQDRMLRGGEGPMAYMPFSTSESAPIVFDAVSDAIPLLRTSTIRPVLRFYAEYADLRTIVEDMRLEEFKTLSPERRVAVHKELTRRRIVTLRWGMRALIAVNIALGMTESEAKNIERSGLNPKITPEGAA
ncbi:hypothetical protein [uncultured Tateyamaria sp.]|nr:hypothetical protein [uncultured Tateyamaria sp.]